MSFGHVGSVATIQSYEKAENFFNSKPAHNRCKGWQQHERCLKDRASGNRHYRIEQHKDGAYYDVCLYSTVMARFYRPNEQGHCRVLYAGHNSNTSRDFQWGVLSMWSAKTVNTTEGKLVVVPLYCNNLLVDDRDKFSADLTYDASGALILEKSQHAPHYTHKANAEDKALRKRIKEKFSVYIMLAQLRLPMFADECTPEQHKGRPFGGADTSFSERMAVDHIWEMVADDPRLRDNVIDNFFIMCQEVYDVLVAKRGHNQDNFVMRPRYGNSGTSHPSALDKPVTEKDLEKAILAKVYRMLGANTASEAVLQPQFMESGDYPRASITAYA